MNKPNPEFEINDPTVVDDQGRSPSTEEVIDPDAHELEADTNRPGEQGISNRPQDEQDDDAADDSAIDTDSGSADSESEDGLSASDKGEARNHHKNPVTTQKKQQGPGPASDKRSVS